VKTIFFFQAEDGIRDSVASRGLGDVYKRQVVIRDIVLSMKQMIRSNLTKSSKPFCPNIGVQSIHITLMPHFLQSFKR